MVPDPLEYGQGTLKSIIQPPRRKSCTISPVQKLHLSPQLPLSSDRTRFLTDVNGKVPDVQAMLKSPDFLASYCTCYQRARKVQTFWQRDYSYELKWTGARFLAIDNSDARALLRSFTLDGALFRCCSVEEAELDNVTDLVLVLQSSSIAINGTRKLLN
ncbi:hypothetical protein BDZ97DRAFT_1753649 [Flammula alnicola]|nr:hypothetical protein BDZ97DRAFT_1753649 [Flammula alnicola]